MSQPNEGSDAIVDLSLMVSRLANALRVADPGSPLPAKAEELLAKQGITIKPACRRG